MNQNQQPSLHTLYQKFSTLSEAIKIGNEMVIIYRGLKLTKRKNLSGYVVTVEDTSHDTYSPIQNQILIEALLEYADRQQETRRAAEDCPKVD